MLSPAELLASKKTPRVPARPKTLRDQKWSCRLREFREALRLSLDDVAGACHLSKTGLYQIEHGADPLLSNAQLLADFFGKDVAEIWPEFHKQPKNGRKLEKA